MLTAILPSMTLPENPVLPVDAEIVGAPPTSSDVTEGSPTQARADASQIFLDADEDNSAGSSSKLAGIVGLFTGFGALLALGLFLPLPAHFQKLAYSPGEAVQYSYYITAAVSLIASGLCFVGLRNLRGEANKTWRTFKSEHSGSRRSMFRSYFGLLMEAVKLGFQNALIGIAYIGGFVARASSVGISLFIPLYVNAYYVSSGICNSDPTSDPSEIKSGCRQAYIMAAKLTGTSQLVALVLAPVFGYAGSRYQRYNMPLIVAALAGIFGYGGFALLKFSGEDRNVLVYFSVALIGVSQIGCIVCSLGSLSRGILGLEQPKRKCQNGESSTAAAADEPGTENANDFSTEGDCLLSKPLQERNNLNYLKGSIAGIYSFGGGVGILLLTKLGGWLFDTSSPAAPFYMLASFNIALLLATFLITVLR
ncbi:hypothetical protein MMC25_008037 [Agyrium rufum]|nr:hypothetical protein [Agyrium rufum]